MAPPSRYVAPSSTVNPQPNPISRYSARSSYYGATGFTPSPGLERARRPFRAKNALTGLAIMAFVGGVYSYSISAVKQDDFADLPKTASTAALGGKSIEEEIAERKTGNRGVGALMGYGSSPQGEGVRLQPSSGSSTSSPASTGASAMGTPLPPTTAGSPQPTPLSTPLPPSSYAAAAANAIVEPMPDTVRPRQRSKWVVGAPDVDRIGRLGERSATDAEIGGRRLV